MTETTFAQDLQQMINDWNTATPEQRQAASEYAAKRAADKQIQQRYAASFTIHKGYFRNDPRFGRTTILLRHGTPVLEVMGVVGIKALIRQYEMIKQTFETGEIMRTLPVRACSIRCIDHPEWGTWGVMEDRGYYYEIHGNRGGRVLSKDEAVTFWEVRQ